MDKKPVIAVFDFDGTLTERDSFFDFIWHTASVSKKLSSLFLIPAVLFSYAGLIPKLKAKEMVIRHFWGNMKKIDFDALGENYSKSILPKIIRKKAMERLLWHKKRGDTVVIVTAAIEDWVKPWARDAGIDEVIGMRLEVKEGMIAGRYSVPNCSGPEKVRRFLDVFPQRDSYSLYAYGNSKGDKELLALAQKSWYRQFGD